MREQIKLLTEQDPIKLLSSSGVAEDLLTFSAAWKGASWPGLSQHRPKKWFLGSNQWIGRRLVHHYCRA